MSKTIKIQSTKKGFKIAKVKVVANEHYIIVDESGKSFNKLKFVQNDKNLEVYAQKDGEEQQVAVLENYYAENMNASVVGLDSANNQEIGYIYNATDGWSYLGGVLPETELGFVAFPLAGLAGLGAAGAGIAVASGGGGGGGTTPTTDPVADALAVIRDAAQNNNATDTTPSLATYTAAKITGVTSDNLKAINSSLNTPNATGIDGNKADTQAEVQQIVDAYNKILSEANGANPDVTPSVDPTSADYSSIGANISDVTSDEESLRLLNDVIKGRNTIAVDTVPEIEDLAKAVKDVMDVVAGNIDNIDSLRFANDLTKIGITRNGKAITLLNADLQNLILEAIKNTADNGSEVDTIQEMQYFVNNLFFPSTIPSTVATTTKVSDNIGNIQRDLNDGDYTDDTTLTLTGTVSTNLLNGEKVKIYDGETTLGYATVSGTTWSFTDTRVLTDGIVEYRAVVSNYIGNSLSWKSFTLNIDTTPPNAPTIEISDDVLPITGVITNNGSTNDTTPTVKVSFGVDVKVGDTIQLFNGTTALGSVYTIISADITNGYANITTPILIDATYNINAKITDAVGNVSNASSSYTVTVDTTPPDAPPPIISYVDNVGIIQNVNSIALTTDDVTSGFNIGTLPVGVEKAILYIDGVEVASTYDSGVLTPTVGLSSGNHEITYSYQDIAGNISSRSVKFTLNIDTTPPTAPIILEITDDTAPITGVITNNGSTNDTTPTVKVSFGVDVKVGDTIQLFNGTTALGSVYSITATDITNGYITITTPVLSDATYNINAKIIDVAGNVSNASSNYMVIVDTTPPDAPIINSTEVSTIITGTCESGATVIVIIAGVNRTAIVSGTSWSYVLIPADITAMGQGGETITATQTDVAGNVSSPASKTISIDTIAPNAPVINTIASDDKINISEQNSTTITGTCESGATVTLNILGINRPAIVSGTIWSYALIPSDITAMGQGTETITATQTDSVGNISSPATKTIIVDTIAPDAPIINSTEVSTIITGTCENGAAVIVTIAGVNRTAIVSGTSWSYELIPSDITAMGQGSETITATQTDVAGNVSSPSSKTISIDTIAPDAPTINTIAIDDIINISEQNSTTITGTCESEATVSLTIGANKRNAIVSGTTWSYVLIPADITAMGQGSETMIATQIDSVGNTSSPALKTISIDTIAPNAPIINTISANNIINISEQNSTIITGTCESGATVTLNILGINRTAIVNGTIWSYALIPADITAMGQGAKTVTATQTDVAGNISSPASKTISIDTIVPIFSSSAVASTPENVSTSTIVYDATADGDSGVIYSLVGGADYGKFNINASTGAVTFNTSPNYEAPIDSGANNVYDFTVRATDTAGNYSDKAVALGVTDVYEQLGGRAGDAIINLGEYGNLIAPIYVGGKWFYHWDRSGDGTIANIGTLNDGNDYTNHNVLDAIFNKDIYGNVNTTIQNWDGYYGTTDVYRYATLYGVKLALPTQGVDNVIFNTFYNTLTEDLADNQASYTDLAKIWDSYNSGVHTNGAPSIWYQSVSYWSATPSPQGHSLFAFWGWLMDLGDWSGGYVALQVLPVTIDLDGDGTISYTQKIMDVNSDGVMDKTAWVDKNDGVLIWDKYHDGKVHDSSQYELSQYGGNTDLEGLAVGFDTNHDGIFDLSDEKFAQFAIWQDLNNDGLSQDGEVKTLAEWGINSINLISDKITRTDDAGVTEDGRTTATKTDGSKVVIGDAGFEYTNAQSDSINSVLQKWLETNSVQNSVSNTTAWTQSIDNFTTPVVVYSSPVVVEEKQIITPTI